MLKVAELLTFWAGLNEAPWRSSESSNGDLLRPTRPKRYECPKWYGEKSLNKINGYRLLFYVSPQQLFNRPVIKPLWMLLSTATEPEIRVTVVHDSFVRTGHLTSSVGSMVTGVVVKWAHDHSVLCGLAFLSIYRNLCVTVAESSLGTNPSTSLLVSGVSGHHLVIPGTRSSWSSATSAGSSSRHVERLPRQVVRRVLWFANSKLQIWRDLSWSNGFWRVIKKRNSLYSKTRLKINACKPCD